MVIDGERLVDRAVRCLRAADCDPVIVVLGAWVGDVPHADDVGSAVVTLVDLPGLTPQAVRRVVAADGDLIVATYDGERGHPVRFDRRHWPDIARLAVGDEGARGFLAGRTDVTFVELGDVASGYDVDVPPE